MDADAVQQEQSPHLMPAALHLSSVFLDVFLEHALNTSNVAEHGAEPAVSDEQLSRLRGCCCLIERTTISAMSALFSASSRKSWSVVSHRSYKSVTRCSMPSLRPASCSACSCASRTSGVTAARSDAARERSTSEARTNSS